jgi:hypothetical protein
VIFDLVDAALNLSAMHDWGSMEGCNRMVLETVMSEVIASIIAGKSLGSRLSSRVMRVVDSALLRACSSAICNAGYA